ERSATPLIKFIASFLSYKHSVSYHTRGGDEGGMGSQLFSITNLVCQSLLSTLSLPLPSRERR
ncbi:MAG: hypothetical protein M0Z75_12320, partial [Nitrospiraceae bacterium]|nr:hypothetical protein [Nitrospiraceae bacterium]